MITPQKKILTRRNILRGMFAAPAIIAIDNLMPVKAYAKLIKSDGTLWYNGKQTMDAGLYYCPYEVVCDLPPIPGAKSLPLHGEFEIEIYVKPLYFNGRTCPW